jgi:hypothetical protein
VVVDVEADVDVRIFRPEQLDGRLPGGARRRIRGIGIDGQPACRDRWRERLEEAGQCENEGGHRSPRAAGLIARGRAAAAVAGRPPQQRNPFAMGAGVMI